jgi:hypothetical protein
MGEPVEQRTGEPLGTEHVGPFVERQVPLGHRKRLLGVANLGATERSATAFGPASAPPPTAPVAGSPMVFCGEPPFSHRYHRNAPLGSSTAMLATPRTVG